MAPVVLRFLHHPSFGTTYLIASRELISKMSAMLVRASRCVGKTCLRMAASDSLFRLAPTRRMAFASLHSAVRRQNGDYCARRFVFRENPFKARDTRLRAARRNRMKREDRSNTTAIPRPFVTFHSLSLLV